MKASELPEQDRIKRIDFDKYGRIRSVEYYDVDILFDLPIQKRTPPTPTQLTLFDIEQA